MARKAWTGDRRGRGHIAFVSDTRQLTEYRAYRHQWSVTKLADRNSTTLLQSFCTAMTFSVSSDKTSTSVIDQSLQLAAARPRSYIARAGRLSVRRKWSRRGCPWTDACSLSGPSICPSPRLCSCRRRSGIRSRPCKAADLKRTGIMLRIAGFIGFPPQRMEPIIRHLDLLVPNLAFLNAPILMEIYPTGVADSIYLCLFLVAHENRSPTKPCDISQRRLVCWPFFTHKNWRESHIIGIKTRNTLIHTIRYGVNRGNTRF